MKIAVTGGIASGKSTVCRLLSRCLGLKVIDADQVCRDLLDKGQAGWQEVRRVWGNKFLDKRGVIDRVLLRRSIFADRGMRLTLESILHPLARAEINRVAGIKRDRMEHLLVEVPLLFEVGWQDDFDWIVTIFATEKRCLQRIIERDEVTLEEAKSVIAAQMPLYCKAILANSVIDNSEHFACTCLQVYHLARCFRSRF